MADSVPMWLAQWLMGPSTGVSAKTIARVLAGVPVEPGERPRDWNCPHDAGDVGRCIRLLDLAKQHGEDWRARLQEVGAACVAWAPLVPIWPDLEAAYHRDVATRREWERERWALKDGGRRKTPKPDKVCPWPKSEVHTMIRRARGEVSDG